MRIALFCGNYNYLREGANQALNRLVGYCERQGDTVRVYSPITDRPAFAPAGTLVPVPSITLPVRTEFQLALGLPRAIRADLRAFAPDLVHVSTPDLLDTRAQTFARQLGLPIVASFHTRFETYLEHYRLGWLRPLAEAHLRRFYRRSDRILVPAEALAADMRAWVGADRVRIWARGVDRELFSPARRDPEWRRAKGWAEDDIVLLFFGRLVVEKGIDRYVEVIRRLRGQGRKVRALAVGAGPAAALFAAVPDIVMTGHVEGESLARAIASADIMIHPSLTETFGNVLLEAMAAGLAIVCAEAPNLDGLIAHDVNGLRARPDGDSLAEAVAMLLDAPDRRRRLAAAAREASAAFAWDAASAQARAAYGELVPAPTPGLR